MKASMRFALLLVACWFTVFFVDAKPIDLDQARQVGQQFLESLPDSRRQIRSDINTGKAAPERVRLLLEALGGKYAAGDGMHPSYYAFNNAHGGFVVVAGDDVAVPVLAYTSDGKWDVAGIPPNLAAWLAGYQGQIAQAALKGVEQDAETARMWATYNTTEQPSSSQAIVGPLVFTKWGQSPFYNNRCPIDPSENTHTLTGCVATAMAQVMRYWRYPEQGTGTYSYKDEQYGIQHADFAATRYLWDLMPERLGPGSTEQEDDAVATLMYHCGVSVDMDYGVDGSSSDWKTGSLVQYFGYANTARIVKRSRGSDAAWVRMLKAELDAQRPVLYGGYVSQEGGGGHAWLCDGYDSEDRFHMNWGWDGSADAFYVLSALKTESGDFSFLHDAVIGIQPANLPGAVVLELAAPLVSSASEIRDGEALTVTFNVKNVSAAGFSGQITASIFDSDNMWIRDVGTAYQADELPSQYTYSNDLTWQQDSMGLAPGDYKIRGRYQKQHGTNWETITAGAQVVNELDLRVLPSSASDQADLLMHAPLEVGDQGIIAQNTPFPISFNVANNGKTPFTGVVEVDFYALNRSYLSEIPTIYRREIGSLGVNRAIPGALSGIADGVDLEPGEYLVGVTHQRSGESGWTATHPGSYENPVKVRIQSGPDRFEPNDEVPTAISVEFLDEAFSWTSRGANIHSDDDFDMYELDLPSGYDYLIDVRIHDSWNSGDDETYTADVLWVMLASDDAERYGDDVMDEPYILENGGWLVFGVSNLGESLGTYALDIHIQRRIAGSSESLLSLITLSTPLHYFYRTDLDSYFYTADEVEKNHILDHLPDDVWEYEGVSHRVFPSDQPGMIQVHEVHDPIHDTHWYTASVQECNRWLSEDRLLEYKGVCFSTPEAQVRGARPVYRFFSPSSNTQYFTISKRLRDQLVETVDSSILSYEGIAWYGFE